MTITTIDGKLPSTAVADILQQVEYKLGREGAQYAASTMANCIKRHFQMKYPGSSHYSPDKVSTKNSVVVVDVPGVARAYHDVTIRPKTAQHIAIPLHRSAYGISPRDVQDLFYTQNKFGTEMLAKVQGGTLVVMYILKDRVFQKQDPTIMPSDQTMADAIKHNIGVLLK